jgi:hypothetical protein
MKPLFDVEAALAGTSLVDRERNETLHAVTAKALEEQAKRDGELYARDNNRAAKRRRVLERILLEEILERMGTVVDGVERIRLLGEGNVSPTEALTLLESALADLTARTLAKARADVEGHAAYAREAQERARREQRTGQP